MKWIPALLLPLLLFSCKKFMYHPNEVRPHYTDLNSKNISKIAQLPSSNQFSFILTGDTQRFYDEFDDFVDHVNTLSGISFILFNGDLVDFGLNEEYNWIGRQMNKLKVPYISAIGNHDLLANGREIFNEMFGPENFSFSYSNSKFIVLNTNGRHLGLNGDTPDIPWLTEQLNSNTLENIFVLSHIAPFSEGFDEQLAKPYRTLLAGNPNVRISLHGHDHSFQYFFPYNDGVPYLVAAATNKRSYVQIDVDGDQFAITQKSY